MDTGQIRSPVIVAPEIPAPRAASASASAIGRSTATQTVSASDSASLAGDDQHPARDAAASSITSGYNRDQASGTIVYQWIDQITDAVVMQIPKEQTVMTIKRVYAEVPANPAQTRVDRSV